MHGVSYLTPSMVVLAVGRKQLFNYVACRFDRDPVHAVQEGAFIVELLTGAALAEGQAWRVHREIVQKMRPTPKLTTGTIGGSAALWRSMRVFPLWRIYLKRGVQAGSPSENLSQQRH